MRVKVRVAILISLVLVGLTGIGYYTYKGRDICEGDLSCQGH